MSCLFIVNVVQNFALKKKTLNPTKNSFKFFKNSHYAMNCLSIVAVVQNFAFKKRNTKLN
jgi:hypothetical protein